MKKSFLFLTLSLLVFASCKKDPSISQPISGNQSAVTSVKALHGNMLKSLVQSDGYSFTCTYDKNGYLQSIDEVFPKTGKLHWVFDYNKFMQVVSCKCAGKGKAWTYSNDTTSNPSTEVYYDSVASNLGSTLYLYYDSLNRFQGASTAYRYGGINLNTDQNGNVKYSYDGRTSITNSYDIHNGVFSESPVILKIFSEQYTEYGMNNLIRSDYDDGKQDPWYIIISYNYNSDGLPWQSSILGGIITSYTYEMH